MKDRLEGVRQRRATGASSTRSDAVAGELGTPVTAVSLRWLIQKPAVTLGDLRRALHLAQLDDNLKAGELKLSAGADEAARRSQRLRARLSI